MTLGYLLGWLALAVVYAVTSAVVEAACNGGWRLRSPLPKLSKFVGALALGKRAAAQPAMRAGRGSRAWAQRRRVATPSATRRPAPVYTTTEEASWRPL